MDLLSLLRMLGGLAVVLGLLAGALWVVRRYDLKLPGRVAGGATRRIELIEKLPIDSRRSVALIRRDGREHLILLAPEGPVLVETAILRDDIDREAEEVRKEAELARAAEAEAQAEALRESVAAMANKVRERVRPLGVEAAGARDSFAAMANKMRERVGPIRLDAAGARDSFAAMVENVRDRVSSRGVAQENRVDA